MRSRRRKRRWAAIPVVLVSALLFGLFTQIDLDAFRGRAVDSVSSWLDQPVTLGGRLGIRWSGGPVLVLPEVEVGDKVLTAREARISVRFWPLLIGEVEPRSVSLVGPRLRLSALAAWRSRPGEWPALPLERLEIIDGAIEAPEGLVIDQAMLTVVPGSPTGPLDVRGTARRGDEAIRLEITIGRLEPGRPVGFAAKVQGAGAEASLAGAINRGANGLELGGPVKLTAADGAKFLARLGIVAVPLAGPATAEAKLAWSEGRMILSDFSFDIGGARVVGRIDLTESMRAGEIQLAFGRLELDRWLDTIYGLSGGADGRDLSLLLSAEAVGVRGGLVRQARAELRLLDRQMALRQLSALGPGGTELTAFGRISSTDATPVYEGEADIVADNLRVALAWLGVEPVGVPPDRLRRAALSFRMTFDGERVTVPSFDLKLDTSRMLGSGNLAWTPAPQVDLRIAVDRITLDPYLPLVGAALASGIGGHVAASADLATWQGIGLRDLDLEGDIDDATIDFRRFRIGDAAGARVAAAGRVTAESDATAISFDLVTQRPAELLRLMGNGDGAGVPDNTTITAVGRLIGSLSDLKLSGAMVSPEGTTELDGTARLAGANAPGFDPGPALRRLIGALTVRGGR